jgi:hypothetical protein
MRAVLATAAVRPEAENEDFAAVMPAAAVLLDGAGTPPGLDSGCLHGVAWFARMLGTTLLARILVPAGSLADCLHDAMDDVRSRHGGQCDLSHAGSPSATVVAVRIAGDYLEHLVLSDSALVLVDPAGVTRVVSDQRIEAAARPYRAPVDRLPIGTPGRDSAFADYVRTVRSLKNTDAGYWVASSDPESARHALTGTTPLAGLRAALLLSDGATRLTDLFELASWDELASLVIESGPAELIRRVRAAEASDPAAERWKRGKGADDATAVCCDQFAR